MLWLALAHAADDPAALLAHFVDDPAPLVARLDAIAAESERLHPGSGAVVRREVAASLARKKADGLAMSPGDLERTVFAYEAFKLDAYVRSGVFPKRYFGFLDGRHDTGPWERRLRETTARSVRAANAWLEAEGDPLRITDLEVAVTVLAEGGALWLDERRESFHPVFDVGLDDLASGSAELSALEARIDAEAGTDLSGLVTWTHEAAPPGAIGWLQHGNGEAGPHAYLTRHMSFEEAVAGTTLMYVWEKRIAATKLASTGAAPLHGRPLDEQFVIASLVYNSGLLHSKKRWEAIRTFDAADWIWSASEENAKTRWRLNVLPSDLALGGLVASGAYPEQPTAWLAGYHVLQRYGAFVALRRFTDFFDDAGALAALPPPEARPAAAPPPAREAPTAAEAPTASEAPPTRCGCAAGGGPGAWLALPALAARRRRTAPRRA